MQVIPANLIKASPVFETKRHFSYFGMASNVSSYFLDIYNKTVGDYPIKTKHIQSALSFFEKLELFFSKVYLENQVAFYIILCIFLTTLFMIIIIGGSLIFNRYLQKKGLQKKKLNTENQVESLIDFGENLNLNDAVQPSAPQKPKSTSKYYLVMSFLFNIFAQLGS